MCHHIYMRAFKLSCQRHSTNTLNLRNSMAVKVAIIGGSGLLGTHLTHGFLANGGYEVTIVTRKGGNAGSLEAFISNGAKVVHVDFSDQASLVQGLKGQEIVVSAVGTAGLADQPKYIEAAKAAGVRRFVPSEFGLDSTAPGFREYFPARIDKYSTFDAVKASGLEYTFIITGFFIETQLSPMFGWDLAAGRAVTKGDPNQKFTLTSLEDVGRWAAEALLDPASKNTTLFFQGEHTSYNEIIKTVEEATGKPLSVTHVSQADLEEAIRSAPNPAAAFVDLRYRAISDGKGDLPGDKLYRSPKDARVTVASFAAKAVKEA